MLRKKRVAVLLLVILLASTILSPFISFPVFDVSAMATIGYLKSPKNTTTGINRQPKVRIWANGTGTLTANFYENSTGAYIRRQTNTSLSPAVLVGWNFTQANSIGEKYYWKFTLDDGVVNNSKWYWFTTKGTIPTQTSPSPANASTGRGLLTKTNITVATGGDGDKLTVDMYYNQTKGTWINYQHNASVGNITMKILETWMKTGMTKYWWRVTVNDGTTNVSKIYWFVTKHNDTAPTQSVSSPTNQSIWRGLGAGTAVTVATGGDLDTMTVCWYGNTTGSWVAYGIKRNAGNVTYQRNYTKANTGNTKYWWKVTACDKAGTGTNVSAIYWYSTRHNDTTPIQSSPAPSNESLLRGLNPRIYITTMSGADNQTMVLNIYNNKTGSWVRSGNKGNCINGTYSFPETWASTGNTKYWWKATLDDTLYGGSTNVSKIYWFTTRPNDTIPAQSSPTPPNGSTGRSLSPYTYITVATGGDNQTMTINWYTNCTGSWLAYGIQTSVNNGTYGAHIQAVTGQKKYWWMCTVYDGTTNVSKTYWFTTRPNDTIPVQSSPAPSNGSTGKALSPGTTITIATGGDNDTMTVCWYGNKTGSWVCFGIKRGGNGTFLRNYTAASTGQTKYWWKVTMNDGTTNVSKIYNFVTRPNQTTPVISSPSPTNASTGQDKNIATKAAVATGGDNDTMTVNWYNNKTTSWVCYGINRSVTNATYAQSETWASADGTKYWWKVTCNDGTINATYWFCFTTSGVSSTLTLTSPTVTPTTGISSYTKYFFNITWASSSGNGASSGYLKVSISTSAGWSQNVTVPWISGSDTTGALYSYNTKLTTVGSYTFQFWGYDGVVYASSTNTSNPTVSAQDLSLSIVQSAQVLWFNLTSMGTYGSQTNMNATGQTTGTPALQLQNQGNIPLNLTISINSSAAPGMTFKWNTVAAPSTATVATASMYQFKMNLAVSATQNLWLWTDFVNAQPGTGQRYIYINTTQGP